MLRNYYNQNGWDQSIQEEDLNNVEKYISSIKNITYLGHGGTCIAFYQNDDPLDNKQPLIVIKVCMKKTLVTSSGNVFVGFTKSLIGNGIKILPMIDILYEDEKFLVYTQNYCQTVHEINAIIISKILKIIKKLIISNIKITDLFFKNFGIFNNDVYIYDYHDYGFFYSNDNYYLTHIAHLFNMYYNKNLLYGVTLTIDILRDMDFGKNIIPDEVVEFIKLMFFHKKQEAVIALDQIIQRIDEEKIMQTYDNYQHYDITRDGTYFLRSHTLEKYNIFLKLAKNLDQKFTVIDYGCSIGGIGMKIAQDYPLSSVTLNNITKKELNICQYNIDNSCIRNVILTEQNMIDDNNTYDVCMYFAILHHILKSKTMDECIDIISKQIKQYAIIELPFGHDVLLKDVISNSMLNFDSTYCYLESIERFTNKIEQKFIVEHCEKIDYETDDLNRYAFILKKRHN
jgi:hypothetical protein